VRRERVKPLLLVVVSLVAFAVCCVVNADVSLSATDESRTLHVIQAFAGVAVIGVVAGLVWLLVTFVRYPPLSD